MENRKFIKFIFSTLGIFLIFPIFVSAYNDKTTHPALTGEIVNLFNYYYPDFKISDADKEAIKKGSTDEDIPPRWMQHFYDPVYNRGLIFGAEWEKSKDWAQDTLAQAKYDLVFTASLGEITRKLFSSNTDYSWDRAVYEYAWGDKEKASESLGHDLHLLEDATVPEHTRNDVHLPFFDWGSPYEDWTSQFNDKNFFLADKLIQENKRPIIFSDLSQYFNNNAIYSNNNFFSKDTIFDKKYKLPVPLNGEREIDGMVFIFTKENNEKEVLLARKYKILNPETLKFEDSYSVKDEKFIVLTDYWNFLSRQAVLSGVGVVKLFFDEVAKEKQSKILLSKNTSLLEQSINKLAVIENSIQTAAIGAWKELTGNGQSAIIVQSLPVTEIVSSSGSAPNPSTALALSSNPSASENDSSQIVAEAQFPEYSPFPSVPLAPNYNPGSNNFTPSLPYPGFGGGSSSVSPQSQTPSSTAGATTTTTATSTIDMSTATSSATSTSTTGVILPVVINEIMYDLEGTDSGHEWVELYNSSTQAVTLIGGHSDSWRFYDSSNHYLNDSPAQGSMIIPPDGYAIFAASTTVFLTDHSNFQGTVIGTAMSLNNTGATLKLINVGGNEVDSVSYEKTMGAAGDGNSLQYINGEWLAASPTPGAINLAFSESPPADTTFPDISFSISECGQSLSPDPDDCLLTASTTLHLSWQSSADDLDYFELTTAAGTSTTTSTSTIIAIQDNASSIFSVMAIDKSGNQSELKTISVEISTMPVVINEVAWAGTGNTDILDKDEWIELYNRTDHNINLSGWQLKSSDEGGPDIIFGKDPSHSINNIISDKGYYLIERTDDNAVFDISADWKGSFGNGLDNGGEILVLSYASTTIDQTVFCEGGTGWCPGFDYKYRTMERIDYDIAGTDPNNWSYNDTLIRNGKNADGRPINGTPKARNSANYLIANGLSYISGNINLTKSRSPYFVNYPGQVFQDNSTLTIEPGVVIKFYNNAGLSIYGKIIAQGAAGDDEQIIFTSFSDDEYGGDTNNDATTTHPYPGDWFGVSICQPGGEGSIFDHTIFRYGGKYYSNTVQGRANLSVQNVLATITNSTFEDSQVHGLRLDNSNSAVSGNVFRFNNRGPDSAGYNSALLVLEGNPTISNNTFSNNAIGLALYDSPAIVSGNYFASNSVAAIYSSGRLPIFTNNSGYANRINGIVIAGNLTRQNETATLKPNSLAYVLDSNVNVSATVVSSSTLIIGPGIVVKGSGGLWGSHLIVNGNLLIQGSKPTDIIFTSLSDNPHSGDWWGINANPGSVTDIKGATISYAVTGILYQGSDIKLENVKFENNNLAISADIDKAVQTISALLIDFLNNTATTSPPGLW